MKYFWENDPIDNAKIQIFICATVLALSAISYYLVEKVYRNRLKKSCHKFYIQLFALLTIVTIACSVVLWKGGEIRDFSVEKVLYQGADFDNQRLQENSHALIKGYFEEACSKCFYVPSGMPHFEHPFQKNKIWFNDESKKIKILVFGDSHGADLYGALKINQAIYKDYQFAFYGGHIHLMTDNNLNEFINSPNFKSSQVILVSMLWYDYDVDALINFYKLISKHNKTLAIVSKRPAFGEINNKNIFDAYISMKYTNSIEKNEINSLFFRHVKLYPDINNKLYNISKELRILYFDSDALICNKTAQQCFGSDENSRKNFYDYGHFTVEGSKFFGSKIPLTWPEFMLLK